MKMQLPAILLLASCAGPRPPTPPPASPPPDPPASAVPAPVPGAAALRCPAGTRLEGHVCIALVVIDCPAGTRFQEGTGCIAVVADPPTSASSLTGPPASTAHSLRCGCAAGNLNCAIRCDMGGPRPQGNAPFGREAATNALSAAAANARSCVGADEPKVHGKVRLDFQPDGTVTNVSIDGSVGGPKVAACVTAAFRGVRIPAFGGAPVPVSKSITLP